MPSIGFGEILVILLIALIVFGPKRLPEMGRTIGRSLREFRRAASEIRSELELDVDQPPPVTVEDRARRIRERREGSSPPADAAASESGGDDPVEETPPT